MKKLLVAAVALAAAICIVRVLRVPAPAETGPGIAAIELDKEAAIGRFAAALKIPTVSFEDHSKNDPAQLDALAEHLRKSFPRVHEKLKREVIGKSLLYTWAGASGSAKPIILTAHMDVVPVEPGTEKNWTHAPFGGEVADGFVWGRGARDDKSSVLALLEAAEWLLAHDYVPPRTIYLAFGEDEEIGGQQGAKNVAATLRSRGVKAEFLLDEGGTVLDGIVPGVKRPVASIMAAEKGYLTVRLTTKAQGGHSSRPPPQTAVGQLARAVARVQDNPFPMRLVPPVTDMLDALAPEMPFGTRLAIANRWLFGGVILRKYAADPTLASLAHTTTAPTVFQAGIKDNVLPSEASALINFRLLPGDTTESVLARLREVINDPDVQLERSGTFASDASEPSPVDNAAYGLIAKTTHELFPDAVISTGLVVGATDARNYEGVFESRYNFGPQVLVTEDLHTIHGTNERIGVEDYLRMVRFYVQLLRNLE